MSLETARALWGAEATDRALLEPAPDTPTADLASDVGAHSDPPAAFRAWALAQPWARFCAIVRIVTGTTRKELLADG